MSAWYEPVDNFAYPVNSTIGPDGRRYDHFGCKHCRTINVIPLVSEERMITAAFQCETCRRWLTPRHHANIWPGTAFGDWSKLMAEHA